MISQERPKTKCDLISIDGDHTHARSPDQRPDYPPIYLCISISLSLYIYIYRERERCIYACIYTHTYMYIYIYMHLYLYLSLSLYIYIYTYTYIYIYIYDTIRSLPMAALVDRSCGPRGGPPPPLRTLK